jgi:predicted phage terminase large subunit-like protein
LPILFRETITRSPWRNQVEVVKEPLNLLTFCGIDTASGTKSSNDYTVIVTLSTDGSNFWIRDVCRRRLEFWELIKQVIATAQIYGPRLIFIEAASSGLSLIPELKRATNLNIVGVNVKGNKISRADSVTPLFQAGRIFLPESALWLDAFEDELLAFPAGKTDDQVDALSLVLTECMATIEGPKKRYQMTLEQADLQR